MRGGEGRDSRADRMSSNGAELEADVVEAIVKNPHRDALYRCLEDIGAGQGEGEVRLAYFAEHDSMLTRIAATLERKDIDKEVLDNVLILQQEYTDVIERINNAEKDYVNEFGAIVSDMRRVFPVSDHAWRSLKNSCIHKHNLLRKSVGESVNSALKGTCSESGVNS